MSDIFLKSAGANIHRTNAQEKKRKYMKRKPNTFSKSKTAMHGEDTIANSVTKDQIRYYRLTSKQSWVQGRSFTHTLGDVESKHTR